MKILSRYILKSYLTAFALTGMVLTFVLSVGFLFRVITFLTQGASFSIIGQFLLASLPEVIGFTIPLSLLVSALLVFNRMSADNEISAMRACGVSFSRIMRWPLIISILCTILGFFIQNEVMPRGHYIRRTISNRLALDLGVHALEPGRFVNEVDDFSVYCSRKDGDVLFDVLAIDRRDNDLREVQADKAVVVADGTDLIFNLTNARITPPAKGVKGTASMETLSYRYEGALGRTKKYKRKEKDFYFFEILDLIDSLKNPTTGLSEKARLRNLAEARFILNNRIVWALSSFCFVLVAIPLGIQGVRKENSRGMMFSLIFGVSFFLFLLLAESLADVPAAHAYLIVWIPVALCLGTATYLLNQKQ